MSSDLRHAGGRIGGMIGHPQLPRGRQGIRWSERPNYRCNLVAHIARSQGSVVSLMQPLDGVNLRYGRGSLLLASAGMEGEHRAWSMKQERRTPAYTTRWGELAVARA